MASLIGRENPIETRVAEIRRHDRLVLEDSHVWTAWADAVVERATGRVAVIVQYADGGMGTRYWDDGDARLSVIRRA